MAKRVEGAHIEFLQMITANRARWLGYKTWKTPGAKVIREAVGTQLERIYIEKRQATVD